MLRVVLFLIMFGLGMPVWAQENIKIDVESLESVKSNIPAFYFERKAFRFCASHNIAAKEIEKIPGVAYVFIKEAEIKGAKFIQVEIWKEPLAQWQTTEKAIKQKLSNLKSP